ncbi:MAG TPA: HAD-IB family phosphatase [Steroidobacteraceae bacterium]
MPEDTHGAPARVLALFDLDGTITRRDTLLPYVAGFLLRHPARLVRLPRVLPALARFLLRRADRGELKSALLQATLGGCSRAAVQAWTAQFVSRLLRRALLGDALATLARHRRQGDPLALLSASPDLYVPAIGEALGFGEIFCTGVAWDGDRLVGRLTTPNRRGAEKVRCLAALRARHPHLLVTAYGNSAADLEHLRVAERGVLVNGSRRARRAAARAGVDCRVWR